MSIRHFNAQTHTTLWSILLCKAGRFHSRCLKCSGQDSHLVCLYVLVLAAMSAWKPNDCHNWSLLQLSLAAACILSWAGVLAGPLTGVSHWSVFRGFIVASTVAWSCCVSAGYTYKAGQNCSHRTHTISSQTNSAAHRQFFIRPRLPAT